MQVTIVDRDEREQQNLVTRRNNLMSLQTVGAGGGASEEMCASNGLAGLHSPEADFELHNDRLTFHALCGTHASVTHSGRTALRPK